MRFDELNLDRENKYLKDPVEENFTRQVNEALLQLEKSTYHDCTIKHPFIFVFGLPRSGTTLLTQLLASTLNLGFINNFVARFWLAPVTGIRLARSLKLESQANSFRSEFGATAGLGDIHEFGYFWRHWLRKESFEDVAKASSTEDELDWDGLYRVLANVQAQFDKPMVMKNIFGSYHLEKLLSVLGKALYVYIEREELDVAVSILNARKRFYSDPERWWSYVPPDYQKIIDLDFWGQIAGQVHYLKTFYESELANPALKGKVVRVKYEDVVVDPRGVLEDIVSAGNAAYGPVLEIKRDPPRLNPSRHSSCEVERKKFAELIIGFRENDGDC